MKLFPIADPVAGEQLPAVPPPISRYPDAGWLQRLEYFTGRALTHTALRLEQQGRAGHLATLGQALSPGVVTGLEVVAAPLPGGVVLEIGAGTGLAASGEIVHLNRNHQVRLDDIQVYAPASLLAGSGTDGGVVDGAGKLGDTLAALRAAGRPLPEAMVLVLQPVTVEHFSQPDSTDPCENDPSDEAFENWQWLDGCRLALHVWPSSLGPLPVAGSWRRNRIAHAIFEKERFLREGEVLPWFDLGVPVALIGLTAALEFAFLDCNAVKRRGGEPKGGSVPISPAGNRFLGQARFEQFNEHLVDWLTSNPTLDPATIRAEMEFRHLPPVGVLPKQSLSPRQQIQHFFPMSFAVRALALPYEQLDLAIEESASLLAYDLNTPDWVEVLVPVPQQHYDPQLLVVETIDPEFDLAIARFTTGRDQWLGRRLVLRSRASALFHAIKGRPLLYPAADAGAVDSLEQPLAFEQQLVQGGDVCRFSKGTAAPPANWFQQGFDDRAWASGPTAIGYGRAGLGTTLDDMAGHYVTLFLRHGFTLATIAEAHRYTLAITTNGGFYAWLNGRPLHSDNVTRPLFNSPAAAPLALETRLYELGELTGRLRAGENVLAIQAHSPGLNSADFSITVALLDTEEGYGTKVKAMANSLPLLGREQYEIAALTQLRSHLDTHTPLSDREVAKLDEIGIEAYIDFLQRKIDQADDRVEFGFLRLRTDIYRVRQMMVGNEVGTKLATSPALAEIAKSDSSVAAKQELTDFYRRLKQSPASGADGDAMGPAGDGGVEADGTGSTTVIKTFSSQANLFLSGELASGSVEKIAVKEGIQTVALTRDVKSAMVAASTADLFRYATAAATEIEEQNPVVGKAQVFNKATVGERLEESSANIAHMAGVAAKGELIGNLLDTDIRIDDLTVPGVRIEGADLTFDQIRKNSGILGDVLAGRFDPVDQDDEAAYFNAGVRALENVVGVLRLIEGRVQAYRRAVDRCKGTMAELQGQLTRIDQRLKTVADELAEARHDVSVARSLKAEEEARIAALNERRDQVLENLVPFLLFRRPRTVDPRGDAPLHAIDPDLSEQPLPLCDLSETEAPEALEAMLDVVRDAPLRWFAAVNLILPLLSRLEDLQVTLSGAKKRAASRVIAHPFMNSGFDGPDKLRQGLGTTLTGAQQRIQAERRKTLAIDVAAFQRLGWQESIRRVPEVVSLGDLIDGSHGRMGASQRAANELAMIARVATCLYVRFSAVPAGIRLDWAERLSQYDAPVDLRNLYSLPRFGEMEYIERHTMQRLVDWLYSRINGEVSDARHLIADLIRVALLSASHAPVNQLIAGYLPAPVMVRPGSRVQVTVDLTRVRIGMAVSMVAAGATLVRGRVADISGGQVIAEVHTVVGTSVQLETGTKVQIGERLGMLF